MTPDGAVADLTGFDGSDCDGSVTDLTVFDGSVTNLAVFDGSVTDLTVFDGSVTDLTVFDGSVTDLTVFDGYVTDLTVFDGSVPPSVLHLGNIYFHRAQLKHGQEGVEIGSDAEVRWLGHLLGIETDWVRRALMTRTTVSREREHGKLGPGPR